MLMVNQLVGFGARRASAPAPAIGEYRANYSSTTNASSYTFTAADLGAADAARLVVVGVAVSATSPGTARAVTSATIGGVAATVHPQSRENNVGNVTFISASVPSGTTGDIVINLSGTALACGVFVWRVVPASSTPIDAISTANTSAASLNDLEIKNGGFLATIALNSITTPTITWSGADAITTEFFGSVENARVSAAWANTTENLTTGDIGVSTYAHIAAVSFL